MKWKKEVQEMFSKISFKLMTDKWDIAGFYKFLRHTCMMMEMVQ